MSGLRGVKNTRSLCIQRDFRYRIVRNIPDARLVLATRKRKKEPSAYFDTSRAMPGKPIQKFLTRSGGTSGEEGRVNGASYFELGAKNNSTTFENMTRKKVTRETRRRKNTVSTAA